MLAIIRTNHIWGPLRISKWEPVRAVVFLSIRTPRLSQARRSAILPLCILTPHSRGQNPHQSNSISTLLWPLEVGGTKLALFAKLSIQQLAALTKLKQKVPLVLVQSLSKVLTRCLLLAAVLHQTIFYLTIIVWSLEIVTLLETSKVSRVLKQANKYWLALEMDQLKYQLMELFLQQTLSQQVDNTRSIETRVSNRSKLDQVAPQPITLKGLPALETRLSATRIE